MLFRTNTKKKFKIGGFCILLFHWVGVGLSQVQLFNEKRVPFVYHLN